MKRIIYSITAFLFGAALVATPARAQEDKPGGTNLFITYRCAPADRPAFRKGLASDGIKRFDELKRSGVIADYIILFNQFVDANTWDAQAIITFNNYAQSQRWREMEREYPGGLTPGLLKIGAPQTTIIADRMFYNGSAGDRSKSIFVVIPYTYRERLSYYNYISIYGVMQFDGWIKEGVISNYGIYFNHHATGAPWDVLLVFEYKGIEGLARREVIKQKVREGLASNQSWKMLQDTKQDFRVEHEVVMSDVVQ